MKNTENKVIYKANKKLLVRILLGVLIIFLIILFAPFIKSGVELLYLNSWTWHKIGEYNFSIKLPRAYKDYEVDYAGEKYAINSSIFDVDVTVEENNEYMKKVPETVYNGGNILNGVGLTIQCLKTDKTTKTLDEIAESHHVLVSINYDDEYEIGELQKEFVKILGNDSVMTSIDMTKGKEEKTLVTYLLPLEDREITIMFFGNRKNISNSIEEIREIVSKIKNI